MKYVYQFGIILAISFAGEVLHALIPLPVPASIYGLILMLVMLMSGILKLERVKAAAHFLIDIMPMMFIPAAVGLMESWDVIAPKIVPYIAVTIISLIVVMAATGRAVQAMIRRGGK